MARLTYDTTRSHPDATRISVIIPTLNEETHLSGTLKRAGNCGNVQTIVVDGGSSDRTREEARAHCAVVIEAPMGRARQMNVGAQYASGEYLIFLHADTLLPENWAESVRQALKKTEVLGGAFSLRIDGHFFGLRIVEALANLRSHRFSMPYGDQAIFVRAMDFRELGGFPDIPIMEDFEFMRRLGRRGRVHILTERVVTSCRRWKTLGILRTTAINQAVILGYYLGVSPARLARFYRRS